MWIFFASLLAAPVGGLEIVTERLPPAVIHRPYTPEPLLIGGGERCTLNNVRVRIAFGRLPAGIRLSAAGLFSGVPLETGDFDFIVRAANDCQSATRAFTLRVRGAPILNASPQSLQFVSTGGGPPPEPQKLLVSADWQDLPYAVHADAPWLHLEPHSGRTPPPGSALNADPVVVRVDASQLAPGTYFASIKVTAWQAVREVLIPVTLLVRAK